MSSSVSTTWFSDWQPTSHLVPDFNYHIDLDTRRQQLRNDRYPEYIHSATSTNQNMANYLPFLLSLGVLSPNQQTHSVYAAQRPPLEQTGNFKTLYAWKQLDFEYPSKRMKKDAIASGEFIQENNLPLGLEVYGDRVFVTMPKWKNGVPATLATVPRHPREASPKMKPYPSWEWHQQTSFCEGLTSVFRVQADTCGRLWVLDSGQIDITTKPKQVCPPQIFVFDLHTDKLIYRYPLPDDFIKQDSLYSNIIVDVRDHDCENAHVYVTDVWRFGLVVFSWAQKKSWRIYDHLFYPEPLSCAYNVHGVEFEWQDGIFGIALGPYDKVKKDRDIYWHPMSSFREFHTKASIVCNETGWMDIKDAFQVIGQSRGKSGHASASAMDRNGIEFFNLVSRDSVGCWDSRKPYKRANIGIIGHDNTTMIFPNDLKLDQEKRQSVWILTNRLPIYLYKGLDKSDVNFRIMHAYTDEAIRGTICDPQVTDFDTFEHVPDGDDCY